MSSRPTVSSSPSHTSTSNPDLNREMSVPYFNETGPIYKKEHVQGNEFVKFVRSHVAVVADKSPHGSTSPEKRAVWFDWKAFCAALASFQASVISAEHDLTATVPPYAGAATVFSTPTTTTKRGDIADITIQAVLDTLVARFASAFTNVLFLPTSGVGGNRDPQTHFFDALRKNLYDAFTHHLQVSDAPECYLSFHRYPNLDAGGWKRSAWEYRLLFVHSDVQLKTVRGLVMTVTLEGSFGDEYGGKGDGEEPWYDVSLDSMGPFSGSLRATQIVVGEGFRCP